MLAENHTHSVPRADDDWRSFRRGMPAVSVAGATAYRWRGRIHAGTRPGALQMETADAQLASSFREAGFSAGDAVNALMTISYFTAGAVLEEQAGDKAMPASAAAPLNRLRSRRCCGAAMTPSTARSGRSVRAGTAVIVDGLAKRRLVVRNVEGPERVTIDQDRCRGAQPTHYSRAM